MVLIEQLAQQGNTVHSQRTRVRTIRIRFSADSNLKEQGGMNEFIAEVGGLLCAGRMRGRRGTFREVGAISGVNHIRFSSPLPSRRLAVLCWYDAGPAVPPGCDRPVRFDWRPRHSFQHEGHVSSPGRHIRFQVLGGCFRSSGGVPRLRQPRVNGAEAQADGQQSGCSLTSRLVGAAGSTSAWLCSLVVRASAGRFPDRPNGAGTDRKLW
jgi:hypothetical protein